MYRLLLTLCLIFFLGQSGFTQPSNDVCTNPMRLCAGQILQGTTKAATTNASEDNNFCALSSATVWYLFTTNAVGGNVTVSFSNLVFNPDAAYGQSIDAIIFNATAACDQTSYIPNSLCGNGNLDFSIVSAIALAPNTTYYVMVNGSNSGAGVTNSAECDFDITISGPAIDAVVPTASISTLDPFLCEGDDEVVETIISNCPDTASFDWYFDNMLISSSETNTFSTSSLTSSGYLKLIMSCGTFCIYKDTTDSIFYDVTSINASAGPDKFIGKGDIVTLEGSGTGTPLWTPANTLTDANIFHPSANPSSTTTYFITLTNGSCTLTDSMNVFIGELITIFSAFSPNGDDINDKWVIRNSAQYPDMEVVVYDRSGQRVFNTTGYTTQDKWWNGTYNDKPLPVSTYFYVIDLKIGDEGIFKGQVNIIR